MNRALPSPWIRARARNFHRRLGTALRPRNLRLLNPHSLLWLYGGILSGVLLFGAFLLIGSDLMITTILCAAWVVAWASVSVGGGFQTTTGWFAFFPLFHFLLFSLPLKVLSWEGAEVRLRAPLSTSLDMLLFFTGLFFAVLVCRFLNLGSKPICSASSDPKYYRLLAWICFLAGTAAYFVSQFGADAEGGNAVGGMGLVNFLVNFKDFSIAAYIFYAWRAGLNVWRRPVFWLFVVSGISLGVLASAKGATSQPIVYVLAAICSIYGVRSYKPLVGFAIFGVVFSGIIYPIMHYARGVEGARGSSIAARIAIMGSITTNFFTDSKFRADVKEQVDEYANKRVITYLPESAGVFDRFIMIGPTDLLVTGVDESNNAVKFHGFELFALGVEISIPRFLYPDKPDVGSSEFLADVAGTRNRTQRTNPVWGWPGELYYSFGLPGVFFGSFALELAFLLLVNLFFGSAVRKSVWFCLPLVSLNMANSCFAIDSMPLVMVSLCALAVALSKCATLLTGGLRRLSRAP